MSFVHLHVHSPFSYLDGASRIDALIEEAALQGAPALACTDHDSVSGAVRFQQKCLAAGLKPIQGAELTLADGHHLTLLATGPTGYANLCWLLTAAHLGQAPAGSGRLALAEGHDRLQPRAPLAALQGRTDGLIALSGCRRGEIPALILQGRFAAAEAAARRLAALFPGRLYLELQATHLPGDGALHHALVELGAHLGVPLVATGDVHYRTKEEFFVHDLLTCVRTLTKLDEAHPERRLNAEQWLKPPGLMVETFQAYPEAVANTLRIAELCEPALDLTAQRYPQFCADPAAAKAQLRELVWAGARERYRRITPVIETRLEHELSIICTLGFADYFLLVWDVVRFARSRGIRCAGRGSAADSAVAYCLGITEVDAIGRGLLFERFLSLERAEKPDIDVDFDARRRDEVAAYVYDRWGREHVAAVATFNTFQARSAIRDLGKAMGFAESTLDWLAKRIPWFTPADGIIPLIERLPELRESGLPWSKLEGLLKATAAVAHLPRFLATHMCGLVISGRPLIEVTPLQISAKGIALCQFDKEYVEDLGLIKLDLLSLRTLSAVEDAAIHLRREGIDPDQLPADDEATYEMLGTGETIGVFQLESPAQRQLQARLGANRFEDLVASVALIRPGPVQGNMVEPFLARRKGEEPVLYLHPKLEPIVRKTYGVVLFQEQAIEIATAIAGFTPGEADQLRRVMTKGRNPEDMANLGRLFREKAVRQGDVDAATADQIFTFIRGYASYGFCEAHAAAFANTAYKTAFLVRHHPAEYFAALMTSQPMGYYPINVLAGDARRRGVGLLPLDINRSDVGFTVEEWAPEAWAAHWASEPFPPPYPESGKAIRIGLSQVKGLGAPAAEQIVAGRGEGYRSLAELCALGVGRDGLEALISAGALDSLHPNRRALLWALPRTIEQARAVASDQPSLWVGDSTAQIPDWSYGEKYAKEYERLGLMVRGHVIAFQRERLAQEGYLSAAAAKTLPAGELVKVAGVPICPHRPPTRSGRTVVFLSLEDETGLIDLTLFEETYQRFGHLIFTHPRPPLAALGRVERRGGHTSITVLKLREWH